MFTQQLLAPSVDLALFPTVELERWLRAHRQQLTEDQATLRAAAMKHLRTRRVVERLDGELARRRQAQRAEEV